MRDERGEPIDLDAIAARRPGDLSALLPRRAPTAIFQFESGGMKDLLRRLQPERFEDLIALNALYRPGPMD